MRQTKPWFSNARTPIGAALFCCILWLPTSSLATGLLVEVSGIEDSELENVWNTLSIAGLLKKEGLVDKLRRDKVTTLDAAAEKRVQRLHDGATDEIKLALQPFGYYQPVVDAKLQLKEDVWYANYSVLVGTPVRVDAISIMLSGAGSENDGLIHAKQASALQMNERLKHQDYNGTKTQLLNAAVKAGYLDAKFLENSLKVDPRKNTAAVKLKLDTGEQYYFGDITIKQDILNNKFIEKYLPFKSGDVFDSDKLIALQLAISDSQYFDRVEVVINRDDAVDFAIPVTVTAVPSRPRKYTVSGGYGTDTGPRVKFGTVFNRVNRRGHNIHTDFLVSAVKQSATAQYEIPMGKAATDNLRFLTRYEEEDIGDGDGETKRFLLGVNYSDIWRGLKRRLYINYLREDFRFGDEENEVVFLTPGASLSYTKADNLLLPREGYSWFVDVHGSNEAVGSDTTFVQAKVIGQRVWELNDRSRFLTKLSYGATRVDSFDDLPTAERFFAGGDNSVRGYAYRSIGPKDDEGNTIGGRYIATASVEADYLFYKDFGAALFFDAGDASSTSSFDFKQGVGIGLRWQSPVGMFRLDFAVPLDDDEKSLRIHLSIGADL